MAPYTWSWNPEALLAIPALAIGYAWALRRFPAAPWRVACFAASLVLLLAVLATPTALAARAHTNLVRFFAEQDAAT